MSPAGSSRRQHDQARADPNGQPAFSTIFFSLISQLLPLVWTAENSGWQSNSHEMGPKLKGQSLEPPLCEGETSHLQLTVNSGRAAPTCAGPKTSCICCRGSVFPAPWAAPEVFCFLGAGYHFGQWSGPGMPSPRDKSKSPLITMAGKMINLRTSACLELR